MIFTIYVLCVNAVALTNYIIDAYMLDTSKALEIIEKGTLVYD